MWFAKGICTCVCKRPACLAACLPACLRRPRHRSEMRAHSGGHRAISGKEVARPSKTLDRRRRRGGTHVRVADELAVKKKDQRQKAKPKQISGRVTFGRVNVPVRTAAVKSRRRIARKQTTPGTRMLALLHLHHVRYPGRNAAE